MTAGCLLALSELEIGREMSTRSVEVDLKKRQTTPTYFSIIAETAAESI